MFRRLPLVALAALVAAVAPLAQAGKKTVCTITVNSSDERETFRRSLPPGDFDFVELVEHGRPDWLASACRKGVACDVLLISGHFDDGSEFYSDRPDTREHLPVDEMERVSCSDSCPGLFSQLKEVYLFGCNTLNADAVKFTSPEIERSLVRAGRSPAEATQVARMLDAQHGESNRDRMRLIFKDVPVIYGFSLKAPLGPSAANVLDRWFQGGGAAEVASGRASPKLLTLFAPVSMTATAGLVDADPQATHRGDVCRFADDRPSTATKVAFMHELLGRDAAEARMFLDRIERQAGAARAAAPRSPDVEAALAAIAGDTGARERYFALARDADLLATRVRMLEVARQVGWLAPADEPGTLVQVIGEHVARSAVGPEDVDLACRLNADGRLSDAARSLPVAPAQANRTGAAAVLACLGRIEHRARVLRALTSSDDADVELAQVYLARRPIGDAVELRDVTLGITQMNAATAQVRALDTLAGLRPADRESLDALTRLFPRTRSLLVQRAIAGVLIRTDYQAIASADVVRALRQSRVKSPDGADLIDVLIRRLQASS